MVDILTDKGVFLDMDPEAEFEITMDNPLLNDDRIPVPFSTAIAFLATPTNKKAFGYLDTMMLPPSVRELSATILIGGIQFCSGTLVYDSIDEEGRISYTFSGRDLASRWSKKLWELDLSGDVYYPLIIDDSKTTDAGIGSKPDGQRPGNLYNIDGKYRNSPDDSYAYRYAMPVYPVTMILRSQISFDRVDGADSYLNRLVVFGTSPDGATPLPDMSVSDFVLGLCKMFCAAVFTDGNGLRVLSARDVLEQKEYLDWDARVSDKFHSSAEPAEGYVFGYADSEDGASLSDDDVESAGTLAGVTANAGDEYEAVEHMPTGDVFSRKKNTVSMIGIIGHGSTGSVYGQVGTIDEILIDRVGSTAKVRTGEDTEHVRTVDVGFRVPRCVPAGWTKRPDSGAAKYVRRMAPILQIPESGADFPTDVYVALYENGQACDKGTVIADPDTGSSQDLQIGESIAADALFERFHQEFAAWLSKDRQVLSVDLNLSVPELAAFRMWQVVRVRSRNFIVSKLSVRLAAGSDGVDVSADLISL